MLVSDVAVEDGQYRSVFVCENRLQAYRAISLWVKESGTMSWIDSGVAPGDRFLDIGANVGIYTIAAAHRAGAGGRVYAVEPHKPCAVALMRNVLRNGMQDRVDILTMPLTERQTIAPFNYTSLEPSVTGSQLGSNFADGHSKVFQPAASELCIGMSVDELIAAAVMEPPDMVKIDVDGIELSILKGMKDLLNAPKRPRSLQVELNLGEHEKVTDFMKEQGYVLDHRHFTLSGERQRQQGKELSAIAHNAVFIPRPSAAPAGKQ